MDDFDYTYESYINLLHHLKDEGYEFRSYDETPTERSAFIRHDVDFSPQKALRMARHEQELGISSTYLFLLGSPMYNVLYRPIREIVREIATHGHEIGLHFSTHQYWESCPPESELLETINDERDVLSTVVNQHIETVSFHNPPEWVFGRTFPGMVSTYAALFFDETNYVGDSNHRWRDNPPFPDGIPETIQILTHPGLYGEQPGWVIDRIREERDVIFDRVEAYLRRKNDLWEESQRTPSNHTLDDAAGQVEGQ